MMKKTKVKEKTSDTALFTALRRTIAHKEYAPKNWGSDYLAEIFLPAHYQFFMRFERIRKNTKNKLARFMPGLTEYIMARTIFFDDLFVNALNNQVPQIVILGAGYDSRAYRFAKFNRGTIIFELDALTTQNRKRKCLKAAHIDIPREIRFIPIDFLTESLSDVLEKAGYRKQERTLYSWEGVSYYLNLESVKETLDFVGHSQEDSVIAFDYTVPISEETMNTLYGAREFMKSMKEHHASEEFMFSIDNGKIESFLAESNLEMIEYLDNEKIEVKYLTDKDGSLLGRITGNFRLVCASPLD
jgi:methyltransferase (TIGR00027 family)